MSIRPEQIRVAPTGPSRRPPASASADGVVREVVYLGSALRLIVDVGAGTTLVATQPTLVDRADRPRRWLGGRSPGVAGATTLASVDAARASHACSTVPGRASPTGGAMMYRKRTMAVVRGRERARARGLRQLGLELRRQRRRGTGRHAPPKVAMARSGRQPARARST